MPLRREEDFAGMRAKGLNVFVSGVMQGSSLRTAHVRDLSNQDYRARIGAAVRKALPTAEVVDPFQWVQSELRDRPQNIRDDTVVRALFTRVVAMARECDVCISNLPEASMGSAVELWEAKRAGSVVLTVSPLVDNWLIRSTTDHNFATLDEFERDFAPVLARLRGPR